MVISSGLIDVLVLGNRPVIKGLLTVLNSADMEFTLIEERSWTDERVKQIKFEVVILDSLMEGLEDACHRITSLTAAPVILLLNGKVPEWRRLFELPVDGFLKEDAGVTELRARIRAILLRKTREWEKL
jgi:DNA-binding response OmpR family regulator